jgi:hypothetical protein
LLASGDVAAATHLVAQLEAVPAAPGAEASAASVWLALLRIDIDLRRGEVEGVAPRLTTVLTQIEQVRTADPVGAAELVLEVQRLGEFAERLEGAAVS